MTCSGAEDMSVIMKDEQVTTSHLSPCLRIFIESLLNESNRRRSSDASELFAAEVGSNQEKESRRAERRERAEPKARK